MKKKLKTTKVYDIVDQKPVARFYYQGEHSHPVRRTVLVIEEKPNLITGYEIREGSTLRGLKTALKTVKSYRKDKIAKYGDYSRLRKSAENYWKNPNESTLERQPIGKALVVDLLLAGS